MMFIKCIKTALLGGAVLLLPSISFAASCCGGGSSASLILPKFKETMAGVNISYEKYDGFWDHNGIWRKDPPQSDLSQTRLTLGMAKRINSNWQYSLALPFVWNDNQYAQNTFQTQGIGDSAISLWYEAFDDITCTFVLDTLEDYKPAMYFGATLNIPTGISPYDDVTNNFDITGRGFYRLDVHATFDKTVYPWNATVAFNYGKNFERSVNREYGEYVEPYNKQLGDRVSSSMSAGYTHFLTSGETLVLTGAYSYLKEDKTMIDGVQDPTSGMMKNGWSVTGAWANADNTRVVKLTYSYSPQKDNWGENFPTTNTLSLGVSHVFD
ncbi:MAG: hypothetical protein R8M46_05195 [Ghiorsea sp.]